MTVWALIRTLSNWDDITDVQILGVYENRDDAEADRVQYMFENRNDRGYECLIQETQLTNKQLNKF